MFIALLLCLIGFGIAVKIADDYFDIEKNLKQGRRWTFLSSCFFFVASLLSPFMFCFICGEIIGCFFAKKLDQKAYVLLPLATLVGGILGKLTIWDFSISKYNFTMIIIIVSVGCFFTQLANNLKHKIRFSRFVRFFSRYGATIATFFAIIFTSFPVEFLVIPCAYETSYGLTKKYFRRYLEDKKQQYVKIKIRDNHSKLRSLKLYTDMYIM